MENARLLPLNLPAKATQEIAGNPVISRLESAIANCFPGLEMDHRNLDRRFFRGLVFDFIALADPDPDDIGIGARLVSVNDSELDRDKDPKKFLADMDELKAALAAQKVIFLHSLQQPGSKVIRLRREDRPVPLDGLVVWRLIRSLQSKEVTIVLAERDPSGKIARKYPPLTASRRIYQDQYGALPDVYEPGELSQSLCSPWQHDFRDCSCNYWASNHPDIVLPAHPFTLKELESDEPQADHSQTRVLWLRWDRSANVEARPTADRCRPLEMDYYEISSRWQELSIVLEGREIEVPYASDLSSSPVDPFPSPTALVDKLRELAAIEHALALEYLYARYSIKTRTATNSMSALEVEHAEYIAHELLMIAASEMMHLRWANQLLWELSHENHTATFVPQLAVATHVPVMRKLGQVEMRPVEMRPLDRALEDFIRAELPSGGIDGQYAKVYTTLANGHPASMAELASRIIADGVLHYARFREIRAILLSHHPEQRKDCRNGEVPKSPDLVLGIEPAKMNHSELELIKDLYFRLIKTLQAGFRTGHADERKVLGEARTLMSAMDTEATRLAGLGIGVPFSDIGHAILNGKLNK